MILRLLALLFKWGIVLVGGICLALVAMFYFDPASFNQVRPYLDRILAQRQQTSPAVYYKIKLPEAVPTAPSATSAKRTAPAVTTKSSATASTKSVKTPPAPPVTVKAPTAPAARPQTASSKQPGKPKPLKHLRLNVDNGRLRKGPSLDAPVDNILAEGTPLTLYRQKGDWYWVETADGKSGWMHTSLFSPPAPKSIPPPVAKAATTDPKPIKPSSPSSPLIQVQNILIDLAPNGEERVVFRLSARNVPDLFTLEGKRPRVVCDFFNAGLEKDVARTIEVDGLAVKRVRVSEHGGKKPKVRAVVDLNRAGAYEIDQFFFERDNTYVLLLKPGY